MQNTPLVPSPDHADPQPPPHRRWDPVVKMAHWSIVAAILANALFTEEGSGAHIWVGYALAAVLAVRLLWGMVGPAEARFSAFPPSLRLALGYVRDIQAGRKTAHHSHNPLGALMVYAIWTVLAFIIASGIAMSGPPSTAFLNPPSPLAQLSGGHDHEARLERDDGDDHEGAGEEEGVWEEVHETAVNLLYVLILLHIAGVAFETRRSGRGILLSMLPGRR